MIFAWVQIYHINILTVKMDIICAFSKLGQKCQLKENEEI
jgi:hypothetical protein